MWITIRSLMFLTGKGLAAVGLGGVVLWQVATHCGPHSGIAYLHVSTPGVDIAIDNLHYHVETIWDSPIVLELSPGPHEWRMTRDGELLNEQKFTLDAGGEMVLVATLPPQEPPVIAAQQEQLARNADHPARAYRRRP